MESDPVIQWLTDSGEPVGQKQSYPRKLIKGRIAPGEIVTALHKCKERPARIVSIGRVADAGAAPASLPAAKATRKRKEDSDKDWSPSGSDTDDSAKSNGLSMQRNESWEEEIVSIERVDSGEESEKDRGTRWKTQKPTTKAAKKRKRQSGQEYVDSTGKEHKARTPRPIDREKHAHDHKSYFSCNLFSDEERQDVCTAFWALGDYNRQSDFILHHTEEKSIKKRRQDAQRDDARKTAVEYCLSKDGHRYRVCKEFFTSTLDICNNTIHYALSKKSEHGHFSGDDNRGKHTPKHKMPEEDREFIRSHINSFPKVESHYVRKDSRRTYLEFGLSMSKMYDLYKEKCEELQRKAYSFSRYKHIFGTEFNIGFHKPRKDQCATCERYQIAVGDEKVALEAEYNQHIARKDACQTAKSAAKEKAVSDANGEFATATFDLQSVLHLPSVDVSPMYYMRKICVYNLTIYNGANKNAHCFYWNEMDGKRGSSEIGSCLLHFIKSLPPTVKHL